VFGCTNVLLCKKLGLDPCTGFYDVIQSLMDWFLSASLQWRTLRAIACFIILSSLALFICFFVGFCMVMIVVFVWLYFCIIFLFEIFRLFVCLRRFVVACNVLLWFVCFFLWGHLLLWLVTNGDVWCGETILKNVVFVLYYLTCWLAEFSLFF